MGVYQPFELAIFCIVDAGIRLVWSVWHSELKALGSF